MYGQHKYLGLGLLDLEDEQGIWKIQVIYQFIHHPKHRTLINIIVDWYQMSTRLSYPVFENLHQRSDYVSSVWFKNLVYLMIKNSIHIILDTTLKFNIQRRKDKCIMDELTRESLSSQQLIRINACRLYLNIIHHSNMIYPDEVNMNYNYLIGMKLEYPKTNLKRPSQHYPSIQVWNLWKKKQSPIYLKYKTTTS